MADYPAILTTTIDTMIKSLETFETDLAKLKKDKGDKNKIKDLEKTVDLKSKAIGAKFATDMKIAEAGVKTLALFIEAQLSNAANFMKTGKESYDKFKNTNDRHHLLVLEGIPGTLQTLATISNEEMTKFAVSWDKYRQFNAGMPNYTKEGASIRQAVMNLTTNLRTKVVKIETLIGEAKSLVAKGKDLGATELPTAESKRAEAQKIASGLRVMAEGFVGKGGMEPTLKIIENWDNKFKDDKTLKLIIPQAKILYNSTVSAVQNFTNVLASMEKAYKNGKSTITASDLKDPPTAALMQTADTTMVHWRGEVKKTQVGLNNMAKSLTAAENRAKKLK